MSKRIHVINEDSRYQEELSKQQLASSKCFNRWMQKDPLPVKGFNLLDNLLDDIISAIGEYLFPSKGEHMRVVVLDNVKDDGAMTRIVRTLSHIAFTKTNKRIRGIMMAYNGPYSGPRSIARLCKVIETMPNFELSFPDAYRRLLNTFVSDTKRLVELAFGLRKHLSETDRWAYIIAPYLVTLFVEPTARRQDMMVSGLPASSFLFGQIYEPGTGDRGNHLISPVSESLFLWQIMRTYDGRITLEELARRLWEVNRHMHFLTPSEASFLRQDKYPQSSSTEYIFEGFLGTLPISPHLGQPSNLQRDLFRAILSHLLAEVETKLTVYPLFVQLPGMTVYILALRLIGFETEEDHTLWRRLIQPCVIPHAVAVFLMGLKYDKQPTSYKGRDAHQRIALSSVVNNDEMPLKKPIQFIRTQLILVALDQEWKDILSAILETDYCVQHLDVSVATPVFRKVLEHLAPGKVHIRCSASLLFWLAFNANFDCQLPLLTDEMVKASYTDDTTTTQILFEAAESLEKEAKFLSIVNWFKRSILIDGRAALRFLNWDRSRHNDPKVKRLWAKTATIIIHEYRMITVQK